MKALMNKVVNDIRDDPKGNEELRAFIASGKDSGRVELSNGRAYRIMSTNSQEYLERKMRNNEK